MSAKRQGNGRSGRYDLRPHASRRVVILATLDTKADEARFLADCVLANGRQPWIVDIGTGGTPRFAGDTARGVVATAAGLANDGLAHMQKLDAMAAVVAGATTVVRQMVERGDAGAVIGIGGGQGTWLATAVMRALPLGFPKLMVSTAASRDISPFVEHADIMMLPSVTDIAGLHSLLRPILANAAAAACGMAAQSAESSASGGPRLALTMFGVTTTGGTYVRQYLEAAGCEALVFHANGAGGATMESLVSSGHFVGVADWTTTEIANELVGGIRGAGPNRLEAAGRIGIPQVVVPGGLDIVNFGPPETVPRRFRGRRLHAHTPATTLMRTSVEENKRIGKHIADKLNGSTGSVRVLIPSAGFSMLDAPGQPFEDADADAAFIAALRAGLRRDVWVEIMPLHINDESFSRLVAEAMLALCQIGQET